MVGSDPASQIYVRNKSKACDEIGIEFEEFLLDENTTQKELLDLIDRLNDNDNTTTLNNHKHKKKKFL